MGAPALSQGLVCVWCRVSISQVLSESYDDVLAAVQESERGRWFLTEHAARLRAKETATVLDAIHKLESVVAGLPANQTSSPAVDRVKAAIAQARNHISSLQPEGKPLSEEAQMFAHLARLSKAALETGTPDVLRTNVSKGIDVALQLVQELENDFGFAPPPKLVEKPDVKPSIENQKYFHQDSDVFAPVQIGASTKVQFKSPVIAKSVDEMANRGARLTIHKGESHSISNSEIERGPAIDPVPANGDSRDHQPAPDVATPENKARITIIRRKPEDLSQVPLADQMAAENAA
jgi:hypothetical protein